MDKIYFPSLLIKRIFVQYNNGQIEKSTTEYKTLVDIDFTPKTT